jgi:biotin carboxyl carrier protein
MSLENLEAPLPGKILAIKAKVGDKVAEGDEIVAIEAMKMENPIMATVSGTVKAINVTVGQAVKAGEVLAVIEY